MHCFVVFEPIKIILTNSFSFCSVHLRMEDKVVIRIGRDGGLQTFELSGLLSLRISDEKYGRIKVQLDNTDQRGIQLQTHPNVDKELFRSSNQIGLKNPAKPFPLNTDVGVLKWRYQTQDESAIPLTSECALRRLKKSSRRCTKLSLSLFLPFYSQLLAIGKCRGRL